MPALLVRWFSPQRIFIYRSDILCLATATGRGLSLALDATVATALPERGPQTPRTDYYRRRLGMGRLSPIRNFRRTGFAKTTQLLATELFDAQRVANAADNAPKLISFADSRQDAARAALDVESNHHVDLRRQILFTNLRRYAASRREPEVVESELAETRKALPTASSVVEVARQVEALQEELRDCAEPSVAMSSVVEDSHPQRWNAAENDMKTSSLIADMVRRGVHPYDAAGIDRPEGQGDDKLHKFEWNSLFALRNGTVFWRDDPAMNWAVQNARRYLVNQFHQTMTDVVFSRTYFSPEESGLGYATVAASDLPEERRDSERVMLLSALMRVITDSYRYEPNPYREEDNPLRPWMTYGQVYTRRVNDFAEAVWGAAA
jgi:DEAD/DEAH box helicase domain-containing protein